MLLNYRMIEYPAQMQELFLSAAHDFLECEHPLEAGKCLENAKELSLAADLYRKTNMVTFSFLTNLLRQTNGCLL